MGIEKRSRFVVSERAREKEKIKENKNIILFGFGGVGGMG